MNIESRILYTQPVNWKDLKFLQPENFKSLAPNAKERLRQSVITNQFTQPFFVWENPADFIFCLDVFHRIGILRDLEAEGVTVLCVGVA